MYSNNLKKLRHKNNYTKEDLATKLGCNIDIYNKWENGKILTPLYVLDDLSIIYNTKISYLLGIDKKAKIDFQIKPLDYNILIKNLKSLKKKKRYNYKIIGKYLNCTENACNWYFNGLMTLQTDKLILLSKLFDIEIDDLCGKV